MSPRVRGEFVEWQILCPPGSCLVSVAGGDGSTGLHSGGLLLQNKSPQNVMT